MDINFWAVIVATVLSIALGMLWYSKYMFGDVWMKLVGLKSKDIAAQKKKMKNKYVIMVLSQFLTAYVFELILKYTTTFGVWNGISWAFLIWVGFVGTVTLGPVLWENKSSQLYFINNMYNLLSLVLMGIIIGGWP